MSILYHSGYYTAREVAEIVGLSSRQVLRLALPKGPLEAIRYHPTIIKRATVELFLENRARQQNKLNGGK